MKKLLRDTAVTLIGVILCSNMAVSDVVKGQKIYLKKMKSKCAISGSEFAGKYSQDQWEEIYDAGKLKDEVKKICHGYSIGDEDTAHLYDFVYEYANDSGKIPNF